jgi:putative spermidine/putrescine transport system substrate-binding protein
MSVTLIRVAALAGVALVATAAQARDLTVVSFGGSYQDAQREVYFAPFTEATGIALTEDSWNGGIGALRAKAEGPPSWDVVQVETDELVFGCEEGIIEPLDWAALGGEDSFLPAAVHECGVGTIVWATVLAYDADRYPDNPPTSWADFFDTETYPGTRGLRRGPRQSLEFALLGDGVPLDQVYDVLATEEGIERAFAKLDSIRDSLIFWEAGAQPPQLLASGELVMTSAYNGRITAANESDGRNFQIPWGAGFVYQVDSWVIMANSDKQEEAMQFIAFASDPENQRLLPPFIPYGPTHKDAAALVDPAVQANIPTSPANIATGLFFDDGFWVDRYEALNERFNAWAAR